MISLSLKAPAPSEFNAFRAACGWGDMHEDRAERALENSLIVISAFDEDELIGFVRVVGDGALNVYIQDLIVAKEMRGDGIGQRLIQKALEQISTRFGPSLDIGLMSAAGKEPFYEQFGFQSRPAAGFGAGMMLYGKPQA